MSHANREELCHEPGKRRLLEKEATRQHDARYLEVLAACKRTTTDGDQPGGVYVNMPDPMPPARAGRWWPQAGCEGLSRAGRKRGVSDAA